MKNAKIRDHTPEFYIKIGNTGSNIEGLFIRKTGFNSIFVSFQNDKSVGFVIPSTKCEESLFKFSFPNK